MNTPTLAAVLVAFALGAGGGYLIASGNTVPEAAPAVMDHSLHGGMQERMDGMMVGLSGKTGDAFDQAFLAGMVVHHEGAVAMAEAALQDAQHAELKAMAQTIISAQTTEIEQMEAWQREWYAQE